MTLGQSRIFPHFKFWIWGTLFFNPKWPAKTPTCIFFSFPMLWVSYNVYNLYIATQTKLFVQCLCLILFPWKKWKITTSIAKLTYTLFLWLPFSKMPDMNPQIHYFKSNLIEIMYSNVHSLKNNHPIWWFYWRNRWVVSLIVFHVCK